MTTIEKIKKAKDYLKKMIPEELHNHTDFENAIDSLDLLIEYSEKQDYKSVIIPLEKYTTDEKIKFFDEMYENALNIIEEAVSDEYYNSDNDEVIKILNLRDVDKFDDFLNNI
jgi:hypothetical protein